MASTHHAYGRDSIRTETGGTRTSHGFIRHQYVIFNDEIFRAPVCIHADMEDFKGFPVPMVTSAGDYMYALPRGKRITIIPNDIVPA
jgi:hypothetical protein